jgi:hypothetical protein
VPHFGTQISNIRTFYSDIAAEGGVGLAMTGGVLVCMIFGVAQEQVDELLAVARRFQRRGSSLFSACDVGNVALLRPMRDLSSYSCAVP